jgi:hypothetical protein
MNLIKLITLILTVFAAALLLSCNEATAPEEEEPVPFTFPHPDGAEWEYEDDTEVWKYVINGTSEHPTGGTVQNIDRYTYVSDGKGWEYVGTHYLKEEDGEIGYYSGLDDDEYEIWLKLPMEMGNKWELVPGNPNVTVEVISQGDVTVPAGTFNDCYILKYYERVGSSYFTDYVYYADGVGGRFGVMHANLDTDDLIELRSYIIPE